MPKALRFRERGLILYGKFFSSAFEGSMVGAGADVFAVWGYVIARSPAGMVEINPTMVAAAIGMTSERVSEAVTYLCSPDPNSRNPDEEGRRLVQEGPYLYRVVSHSAYRAIRNEDDRREYNRIKQQESRQKRKAMVSNVSIPTSLTVNDLSAVSAHTEAEIRLQSSDPPTPLKSKPPKPRRTQLPAEWSPTAEHRATADKNGVNCEAEAAKFRLHAETHARLAVRWNSAFSSWLIKAAEYRGAQPKPTRNSTQSEDEREALNFYAD